MPTYYLPTRYSLPATTSLFATSLLATSLPNPPSTLLQSNRPYENTEVTTHPPRPPPLESSKKIRYTP